MPFSTEIRNTSSSEALPVRTSFYLNQSGIQGSLRILWWPPKIATNSPEIAWIIVFTCGNPGIPEWYIDFLTLIRERAPGAVAIAACGHIGHAYDLQKPPARSSLSLGAQIEAHAALLQDLHQLFPHARFVSLSHSIGGYISMKVASRFPDIVTFVVALQPTISNMAYTPNGRVMKYFFLEPLRTTLALLAVLFAQAFPFLLPLLYSSWKELPLSHLKNFVSSPSTTHASMTMASDEMASVVELDKQLLSDMREKFRIIYSESGDGWVGDNSVEVMRVLREASHIKFLPIPHAFCLNHSKEAAEACFPWIQEALSATQRCEHGVTV